MSYFLFLVFSGRHHACMIRDSKYLYGLKKCRVMIHFPIRMHMVGDARILNNLHKYIHVRLHAWEME